MDARTEVFKQQGLVLEGIDCGRIPMALGRAKVREHVFGGILPVKHLCHLSTQTTQRQREGKLITGYEVRQELRHFPLMNATLLDWFLKHTEYIPVEWRDLNVYFWGTIYLDASEKPFVRHLECYESVWCWGDSMLSNTLGEKDVAAVFVK
jgi:hypothetical protein